MGDGQPSSPRLEDRSSSALRGSQELVMPRIQLRADSSSSSNRQQLNTPPEVDEAQTPVWQGTAGLLRVLVTGGSELDRTRVTTLLNSAWSDVQAEQGSARQDNHLT